MENIQKNNYLLRKPEFSSVAKTYFFIKNIKNNKPSASDWWKYAKYRFKENAKILSKNSSTQKSITISRNNLIFLLKTQKRPLQQVSGGKTPNLVLNRMPELFLKVPCLKKILKPKKDLRFVQKENLEPKIKPMIEHL